MSSFSLANLLVSIGLPSQRGLWGAGFRVSCGDVATDTAKRLWQQKARCSEFDQSQMEFGGIKHPKIGGHWNRNKKRNCTLTLNSSDRKKE